MILFLFSIFNVKELFSIVSPPTFHLAPRSLEELSYPKKAENVRPHSSNSLKSDPIIVNAVVKMRPHPAAHPH